jgi:hypothetical protein
MPKEVRAPKVVVEQDQDNPVEHKVLARSILLMSKGVVALLDSGIKRDDMVTLILRRCPSRVGRREVEDVLSAIQQLRNDYR